MTIDDVKELWERYKGASSYSYLQDGKWNHVPLLDGAKPPKNLNGVTSATYKKLADVMEFPEFVERYSGGE